MGVRVMGEERHRHFAGPEVVRLKQAMRRIDRALDNSDRREFALACRLRGEILRAMVVEVVARAFVPL